MRFGLSAPCSTSASATSAPALETETSPSASGARRGRAGAPTGRARAAARRRGLTSTRAALEAGCDRLQAPRQRRLASLARAGRDCSSATASALGERADAGAPQRPHMAEGSRAAAEIARERAHIGALAALGLEHRVLGVRRLDQREPVDLDRPRRELDLLALAREVVGALALDLERGVAAAASARSCR